jgi:hypothetical protein
VSDHGTKQPARLVTISVSLAVLSLACSAGLYWLLRMRTRQMAELVIEHERWASAQRSLDELRGRLEALSPHSPSVSGETLLEASPNAVHFASSSVAGLRFRG